MRDELVHAAMQPEDYPGDFLEQADF